MSTKARDYKPSTKRKLDVLSGNECAAPHCQKALFASDDKTLISKICHIEAASENGPRFNPNMTDDDRRHYNNLILLCDECHSIIDNKENESGYPVSLLKEWKSLHERKNLTRLSVKGSMLSQAIDIIAEAKLETQSSIPPSIPRSFRIEDKIEHNNIKRNKSLIDEYKIFFHKINSLYNELEANGSFKKENLLRNIRNIYLKVKGEYIQNCGDETIAVRENADNIIEDIEDILISTIDNKNLKYGEDISFGVTIIMVDAFMRCKILEKPTQL